MFIFIFLYIITHIGITISQYYAPSGPFSEPTDSFDAPWETCHKGNRPGRCIPLPQCPELKSHFHERNKYQVSFLLQQYGCGFHSGKLHVCCPSYGFSENHNSKPHHEHHHEHTTKSPWRPDQTSTQKDSWTWPKPTTTQKPIYVERPTTQQKPERPTPSSKPPSNNKPSAPSSPTKHRNLKLLPLDSCGPESEDKIIGGSNTRLDEFPWTVLLEHTSSDRRRSGRGCGGSLISSRYVLTAAHCITGTAVPRNMKVTRVRLGEYDLSKSKDCQGATCSPNPIDADVEDIIVHPNYRPQEKSQYNDIALIRLKKEVPTSAFVYPICLPLNDDQATTDEGEKLVVAGWGRTANIKGEDTSSKIKQKVSVPVVNLSECSPFYTRNGVQLRDTQICAGGQKNKDSCQGDSGGPLMGPKVVDFQVRWYLQGIVSFGPEICGAENIAGIYTRVSKYTNWILDNMKP